MEKVNSFSFNFSLTTWDILIFVGILILIYLVQDYTKWKLKQEDKQKEKVYFRVQNRAQLLSEITIGLKIVSNLKTLIHVNKLTDLYFSKCLKRLEQIVICYDSEHGIEYVARIHQARDNKEKLKIELSLLELEFRKV